jgi:hypothetical protein
MYTLVMALAASLAMGNDPVVVSAEVEQRLDPSGEWEGSGRTSSGLVCLVRFQPGEVRLSFRGAWQRSPCTVTDEGEGQLRIRLGKPFYLGIYERDGDRVTLCLRQASEGRPTSFRAGDGQHLLILRRVRPGK